MAKAEGLGAISVRRGLRNDTHGSEVKGNALNGELIHLTPRQQEIFNYIALGLSTKEIGEKMGITPNSVNASNNAILSAFGAYNMLGAVIKGVGTGNIDLNKATGDLDINGILKLSEDEGKVLDAMTDNGGENNINEEIAPIVHWNESTVAKRLRSIFKKLGINRTRTALLYMAYKRENTPPDL